MPKNLNPNGKYIKVMDNNFFANPLWREAIKQLKEWDQPCDFQGVDVRLLNEEQAEALMSLKHHKTIKIAWDWPNMDIRPHLKKTLKHIPYYKLMCYVLIGYNSTPEQDLYRVEELRKLKIDPFVMPFDKFDHYQKNFSRWANKKQIFRNVAWKDYKMSENKQKSVNGLYNVVSIKDNWETPPELFREWNKNYSFDLDPCASHQNRLCERFFTKQDNGLNQSWDCNAAFVNPPYSQVEEWIKKCFVESKINKNAKTVVALVYSKTETKWFHNYIWPDIADEIHFIKGRVKFYIDGQPFKKGGAPFGSMIVVWHADTPTKLKSKQMTDFL